MSSVDKDLGRVKITKKKETERVREDALKLTFIPRLHISAISVLPNPLEIEGTLTGGCPNLHTAVLSGVSTHALGLTWVQ